MNKRKLKEAINWYIEYTDNLKINIKGLEDRRKIKDSYKKLNREKILAMNKKELNSLLTKLWSFQHYHVSKIYKENGGFENVKRNFADLLFGKDNIDKRWDKFKEEIKYYFTSYSMSEVLSYIYPNDVMIWNSLIKKMFLYLEIEFNGDSHLNYSDYEKLVEKSKEIQIEFNKLTDKKVDLLDLDYFYYTYINHLERSDSVQNKIDEMIKWYKNYIDKNPEIQKDILKNYKAKEKLTKNLFIQNINTATKQALSEYINNSYSFKEGRKKNRFDDILKYYGNNLKKVKESLSYLLDESIPLEDRWNKIVIEEPNSIGKTFAAELLCSSYPEKYFTWSTPMKKVFEHIGYKTSNDDDYESYYNFCEKAKEILKQMNRELKGKYDLLYLNNSLYEVNKEYLKTKVDRQNKIKGYNMIYYGVPGCGKSTEIKSNIEGKQHIRVTFYPDYSYQDFIGQIVPETKDKKVEYNFIEGPFIKALKKANENPNQEVYLIIEELNRGNASGIFGDIFQLLDRDENGNSEFPITNSIIAKQLGKKEDEEIIIPNNLYILATMNTSDQNVYTLDNAFKRRWRMKRIKNVIEDGEYKKLFIPGTNTLWKTFMNKINDTIRNESDDILLSSEDKEIGAYFATKDMLIEKNTKNKDQIEDKMHYFAEKVLYYIWDDIVSLTSRKKWFGEVNSFDTLCDNFYKDGLKIFKNIDFENEETDDEV